MQGSTSDSIVLNSCSSWINLGAAIIKEDIRNAFILDLRMKI
ncbi:MAG: hypothetical protein WCD89_18905 [Anaerocolumna sp.]